MSNPSSSSSGIHGLLAQREANKRTNRLPPARKQPVPRPATEPDTTAPPAAASDTPSVESPTFPAAPLTAFAPNPRNRAHSPEAIQRMTTSLRSQGQIQPVRVVSASAWLKRYPDDTKSVGTAAFVFLAGELRWRCAPAAGLTQLTYIADDSYIDDDREPAEIILAENGDREDLTCMDEARCLKDLLARYGNASAVAERVNFSRTWVQQRLGLHNLCQEAQDAVDLRKIDFTKARQLAPLERQEQLARLAGWGIIDPPEGVTRVTPSTPRVPTRSSASRLVRQYTEHHGVPGFMEVVAEELPTDELKADAALVICRDLGPESRRELAARLTASE